jgi:hypothetical protein
MDILLEDFLRRFWREVTPLLDWVVNNWAAALFFLALVLVWTSRYRGKLRR